LGLLDFSSNLNPLGAPRELRRLISEAVERGEYLHHPTVDGSELKDALTKYEGVSHDIVHVFSGATEAIQLLLMHTRPRRIIVPIPNYSDYIRLAKLVGSSLVLREYMGGSLISALHGLPNDSLVVISNPNTPLGYLVDIDELLSLASELSRRNGVLLVDESFIDFTSAESILRRLPDNTIVVKSYTKFLSIPGLRVGALFANIDLRMLDPPWPVNSIAEYALSRYMPRAGEFRELTVNYIREELPRVISALEELGIHVLKTRTHYFVIKHDPELGNSLVKLGILIRDLRDSPGLGEGYFRIAIKSRNENDVLIRGLVTLTKILNPHGQVD